MRVGLCGRAGSAVGLRCPSAAAEAAPIRDVLMSAGRGDALDALAQQRSGGPGASLGWGISRGQGTGNSNLCFTGLWTNGAACSESFGVSSMSRSRLPGCPHGAGTGHSPVHAGRAARGGCSPTDSAWAWRQPQVLAHPRSYLILPYGLGWSSCPQRTAGSCSGCDASGGQGAVWGVAQEGYPEDTEV